MASSEIKNFEQIKCLLKDIPNQKLKWTKISSENLDLDYSILFPINCADFILKYCEKDIEYLSDDVSKVKVFGKWHVIPRQQVAFGDSGLSYKFSGAHIPAFPWLPIILLIRNIIEEITSHKFNFVLINKYRNGSDHIGEHRDDEKELDPQSPIVSISFCQERLFVLKHKDTKKKGIDKRNIDPVKIILEHGSILIMNPPTNNVWYHSLPPQKKANGVRINMTFRKMIT